MIYHFFATKIVLFLQLNASISLIQNNFFLNFCLSRWTLASNYFRRLALFNRMRQRGNRLDSLASENSPTDNKMCSKSTSSFVDCTSTVDIDEGRIPSTVPFKSNIACTASINKRKHLRLEKIFESRDTSSASKSTMRSRNMFYT